VQEAGKKIHGTSGNFPFHTVKKDERWMILNRLGEKKTQEVNKAKRTDGETNPSCHI
jgi:hypothetical protein